MTNPTTIPSRYHVLAEFIPERLSWSVTFGDYSHDVVLDERADRIDSGTYHGYLRILWTTDRQSDVDATIAATPLPRVDTLKRAGDHRAAGRMSHKLGEGRDYGCHFGMRSDRELAIAEFHAGYDEAETAPTEPTPPTKENDLARIISDIAEIDAFVDHVGTTIPVWELDVVRAQRRQLLAERNAVRDDFTAERCCAHLRCTWSTDFANGWSIGGHSPILTDKEGAYRIIHLVSPSHNQRSIVVRHRSNTTIEIDL